MLRINCAMKQSHLFQQPAVLMEFVGDFQYEKKVSYRGNMCLCEFFKKGFSYVISAYEIVDNNVN